VFRRRTCARRASAIAASDGAGPTGPHPPAARRARAALPSPMRRSQQSTARSAQPVVRAPSPAAAPSTSYACTFAFDRCACAAPMFAPLRRRARARACPSDGRCRGTPRALPSAPAQAAARCKPRRSPSPRYKQTPVCQIAISPSTSSRTAGKQCAQHSMENECAQRVASGFGVGATLGASIGGRQRRALAPPSRNALLLQRADGRRARRRSLRHIRGLQVQGAGHRHRHRSRSRSRSRPDRALDAPPGSRAAGTGCVQDQARRPDDGQHRPGGWPPEQSPPPPSLLGPLRPLAALSGTGCCQPIMPNRTCALPPPRSPPRRHSASSSQPALS
jgi:hypothetical protein